jgi:hypothetical protein
LAKSGVEVLEIFSSDDEDMVLASDVEGFSAKGVKSEFGHQVSENGLGSSSSAVTDWWDPNVRSRVVEKRTRVTRQFTAERLEYLTEIPSVWPVPRVATAYILDLRDPKFDVVLGGKVLRPDALIKNKVRLIHPEYLPGGQLIPL